MTDLISFHIVSSSLTPDRQRVIPACVASVFFWQTPVRISQDQTFDIMDEETLKLIAAQLRKPEGDDGAKVGELMNEGNRTINQDTMAHLNITAGNHVLEVGMGNGHFVGEVITAADNVRYVGCDYSSIMVTEAEKRNAAYVKEGKARFTVGNAESLPFEDDTFDLLFSINTIYFWDNPEAVAKEFGRVLRPGARMVLGFRPEAIMSLYPVTQYNFRFWNRETASELFEENGFEVTEVVHNIEPPAKDLEGNEIRAENLVLSAVYKQA